MLTSAMSVWATSSTVIQQAVVTERQRWKCCKLLGIAMSPDCLATQLPSQAAQDRDHLKDSWANRTGRSNTFDN